jgi:hypothetical protein
MHRLQKEFIASLPDTHPLKPALAKWAELPRCGAKTRSGEPCRNVAMRNGSGKCRMHGGKSKRGPKHPNYKKGTCSKQRQWDRAFMRLLAKIL